ncbi:hypothetical protein ACH61_00843 [Rathayibacter tanaceti]|uniref:Uncharacterized protein n=1 Tax=Rathayibacter tanaceti TaxID=1671680 RepID=A0A162GJ65_9MICO|nr:hypothetical protein ACH61_00843 [Rathayibacter tanaceti]
MPQAVRAASGTPAASTCERVEGFLAIETLGTLTYSA